MDNYHWQNLLKEQKVIHRLYDFCSVIPIPKIDNDKTLDFLHLFFFIPPLTEGRDLIFGHKLHIGTPYRVLPLSSVRPSKIFFVAFFLSNC